MIELNKFDRNKKVQFFYLDESIEKTEVVTCDILFVVHDKEDDVVCMSNVQDICS